MITVSSFRLTGLQTSTGGDGGGGGGDEGNLSIPIGGTVMYAGTVAPTGYLLCNGLSVSTSTYSELFKAVGKAFQYNQPTISGEFYLPDMRGLFVRGCFYNEIMDLNGENKIGTLQEQGIVDHGHQFEIAVITVQCKTAGDFGDIHSVWNNNNTQLNTLVSSEPDETRPHNVALNYIIRYV
jgi:microcystin-dependent protein